MVQFVSYKYDKQYLQGELILKIENEQVILPKGSIVPIRSERNLLNCMTQHWQLIPKIKNQYNSELQKQIQDVINDNLIPNSCMKCKGCI